MNAGGEAPSRSATLLAVAALVAAMICFQVGASIAKSLFPIVGAEGATTLRQVIGALMLAVVLRPWRHWPTRKTIVPLLFYGMSLGFMNLLFYMALRTIPLGIAVALEFCGPLAVAAASLRRPKDFAWLGLAVIGLALLLPLRASMHAIDPRGALLALGGAACWAIYIIAGKRAGQSHGAGAVAFGAIIAALSAAPFGIAHAGMGLLSPAVLPMGLALAVFSNALPYALEMIALTRIPARVYGTLVSGDPAFAALAGLLLLGEALSPGQWAGIVAIVLASVGTALSLRPSPPLRSAEANLQS